jgi:murein DD-endopeptidase MepM/ murein hydrolase activator NlpD
MSTVKLRILLGVLFLVIVGLVAVAIIFRITPVVPAVEVPSTLPNTPVAIGTPISTDPVAPSTEEVPAAPVPEPSVSNFVGTVNLIIPVAGVKPDQLLDTFGDARSEGRLHDAIDIMAPGGTPVLAAADGRILKLFQSERGGTTIYQLGPTPDLIFYYAHLASYAPGVVEGKEVRQGDVIAYVGDTGNAGSGNYHLHFSVAVVSDPKRYWEGTNINPYPLLRP